MPGIVAGDLLIDFAVYGAPNRSRARDLSCELEDEVFRLGGTKTLIGRNHYDRERFWQVYNRPTYGTPAKAVLDPNGRFPDLYDKLGRFDEPPVVSVDAHRTVRIVGYDRRHHR